MEILRVSGTPAELRAAGILDLVSQSMAGEQAQAADEVPDEQAINQFVTRARNEFRPHVKTFLDAVRSWEGCRIGTLNARYMRIEAGHRGTLVYVVPSRPTADIYFAWDENTEVHHGRAIEEQGWTPRLVQIRLDSEQAVDEALDFARQAYERQQAA